MVNDLLDDDRRWWRLLDRSSGDGYIRRRVMMRNERFAGEGHRRRARQGAGQPGRAGDRAYRYELHHADRTISGERISAPPHSLIASAAVSRRRRWAGC